MQRKINRLRILDILRSRGAVSRADLSRLTGLKRSSVTYITQELLDWGIIAEKQTGAVSALGGRRPIMLELAGSWGCFAGIEADRDCLKTVFLDLTGRIIDRETHRFTNPPEDFPAFLEESLKLLRQRYPRRMNRLIALGAGISGSVDPGRGIILHSRCFSLSRFPLTALKKNLPFDLLVENDSNCCVWGEVLTDEDRSSRSCMYLLPKTGATDHPVELGIGIAVSGEVYYGSRFLSGEATTDQWYREGPEYIGFAKDEDLSSEASRRRVIRGILTRLLPLFRIFDPDRIIIGGDFRQDGQLIRRIITEDLRNSWFAEGDNRRSVHMAAEGAYETAHGAAAFCLLKAFEAPRFGDPQDAAIDLTGYVPNLKLPGSASARR